MFKKINNRTITQFLIVFILVSILSVFNPLLIKNAYASTVTRLKDLPKNSIVYDPNWTITYYSDQNNTVRKTGVVDWKVVAKNYYGKDEVTLMTNEYWNIGVMLGGTTTSYSMYKTWNQYNNAVGNKDLFDKNIIRVMGEIRTNAGSYIHNYSNTLLDKLYYISLNENNSWQVFPSVSNGGMWTRINGNWSNGGSASSWYRYSSASSVSDIDSGYTGGGVPLTNLHGNTGVELQPGGKYKLLLNETPEVTLNTPANETNLNGSHISITGIVKDGNIYDTLNLYYTVSTFDFGKENYLKPIPGYSDVLFEIISANGTNQAFAGWIPNNPVFPKGPLAVTVYARDDVGGISELATAYIANNNSTRYFYDRFNVVPTNTMWNSGNFYLSNEITSDYSPNYSSPNASISYYDGTHYTTTYRPEFYTSYTFNKLKGSYDLAGTKVTTHPALGTPMYTKVLRGNETVLLRIIRTRVSGHDDDGYYEYTVFNQAFLFDSIGKGTLHTTNVVAPDLSLPNDGIHWDGFWYVKKGLANFTPAITVNTPSTIKYFGANQDISISGTIQDGDNDTVTISATINGVVKSTTVSNTLTAKPWTLTWLSSEVPQGVYSNATFNANDGFGGTASVTHTANIVVDKTNPNAPNMTVNENWTNVANVPVTILNGTDTGGSNVNRTEYSLSGATTLGWTTYSAVFNISNAGQTTITARTIDNAGNMSSVSTRSVRIDRTNPNVPTINANESWTNAANVPVTIVGGTDIGDSGVNRTEYSLSGATISGWITYSAVFNITNAGETTISARTIDNAGNISTVSTKVVRIDGTNPNSPNITVNESWTNAANVPVTIVHGTDTGGSNVNRTEYSLSGATTLGWTTYSGAFDISNAGETTITARTIDGAGNISSVSSRIVRVDRVNPTGVIAGNTVDWINTDIFLNISTSDLGGSNVRRVRLPDNSWFDGVTTNFPVTANGSYSFVVEDNAGNQTTVTEVVDKIDKLSPVVDADNKDYHWTNTDIAIAITYQDDGGSGLRITQYKISDNWDEPLDWVDYQLPIVINHDGKFYFHYLAIDNAGNESKGYFGPYQRDTLEPTITVVVSTDEPTNEDIKIQLEFKGNGSSIVAKKWGLGVLSIYDIRNIGIDIDPTDLITVAENGYYTIYTRDEAGNEVIEVISINVIDKTPPTVSANNLDYDWKNSDIAVELDFQDEGGSELYSTQYRVTMDSATPLDWEDYTDEIIIDTDGECYIHYWTTDHAGNETVGFFGPYKLDKEIPTVPSIIRNPDVDHNRKAYEVSFTAGVDNVSGINEVFYQLSGASVRDWTLYAGGIIDIDNQGETTIEVMNTDFAGNESDITTIKVIVYGEAYDKAIEALDRAEGLVDIAKGSLSQADVDNARAVLDEARNLINLLPDSSDKTQLTDRLVELEAELEIVQTILDILDTLDRIEAGLDFGTQNPNQNTVDCIRDLISDTQVNIDSLSDGAIKDDLQNQLNDYKDRLDELQQTVTIITTLTMKLDNADLDFTINPARLLIDSLDTMQHYKIVITDLETGTVIVDTKANGTIQLPDTFEGHLYKVELEAYHDGELIVQRTFEKLNPDTINPVIEYAYVLNNNLVVHASDNYKLHNTPYGFTLLDLGGTTVLSVEANAFNSVIIVSNNNGTITNINFSADNNITLTPPKYVIVKVIDSFLNSTEISFDVTKANEILYGNVPQDIIEKIHLANNPPSFGDGGSGGVIPEVVVPPNLSNSLDNALGDNNISVNPLPTEPNSGTGGLIIDSKGYINELKTVLNQNNYKGSVYYRIDVIEKGINKLVYTNTVSDIREIIIPGLADSTTYIVRISIVHDGVRLAFREIEKQTGDATPPIIEKITINDGTLQVFASDNMRLHEAAYQYQLQIGGATTTLNPFGVQGIAGLMIASIDISSLIASNWNQQAWTSESRLSGLDTGTRVKIIVRDHADNYTMTDIDVKGNGTFYDTVNGNQPLALKPNQSLDLHDILQDLFQQYNYNNPTSAIDIKYLNLNDYELRLSDPSIAYIDKGYLVTRGNGNLVLTFIDKKTGILYKYSILISDILKFDRRIIIQTNSETDIKRVFEKVIEGEFQSQRITLVNENTNLGELEEETSIFRAYEEEGLAKIMITNGRKEVPVYVIVVKNKFPESDIQLIKTKLAYVLKEGDRVDVRDISVFYNEYFNEANTDYLIIESGNSSVKVDGSFIEAVGEGLANVQVIDLVTQMIEVIDFRVISFNNNNNNNTTSDVDGHWAEKDIKELQNKGLLNEFSDSYSPEEYVTRQEFLNAFSQLKVYLRDNVVERRNVLPLEIGKEDINYYSIMNALNNLTVFEVEYVLGKTQQFSKVMTREEVAALLAMEFNLKAAADGGSIFKDLGKSKYHNEILAIKEAGIMEGFNSSTFNPNRSLTRAEMATIFKRILKLISHEKIVCNNKGNM